MSACDKEVPKPAAPPEQPAPNAPPAAAPAASAKPRAPLITLDDVSFTIDGTVVDGEPSKWPGRAADLFRDKPLVAGEAVVVNVTRDAHMPRLEGVVAALDAARARSIVVRTATRDQSAGEVELTLRGEKAPDCSVAATIEKDGSVVVRSKGGGGAQRFARGMAGPDLTASSEAVRRRTSGCDSPFWFVGGAEGTTWGLTFDLATRAKAGDAGPLKPTRTGLVARASGSKGKLY